MSRCPCIVFLEPQKQEFGECKHDHAEQKQHEAKRDQRRHMQGAYRFCEFISQRGSDGTAWLQQGKVQMMRVADNKGDGMVSPSARPRPRKMPPVTATRVCGRTTWRTTSQVVAPRPYADSLRNFGVVTNTSRMIALM